MPANSNPKRQACVDRIFELNKQLSLMNPNSMEYKAVLRVKVACDDIVQSLDSDQKYSLCGQLSQMFKQSWRGLVLPLMGEPTDEASYQQVLNVLNLLTPAMEKFNHSLKISSDINCKNQKIQELGNMSQTLLGHPNPKFQKLGGAMAFMGVVLIVASLLAAPATFGLSLALPAAVVLMASWIAMVPPMTLVMGSLTAAGGVYTGVSNLRETGLAKAVSDLTALDSMKPKP